MLRNLLLLVCLLIGAGEACAQCCCSDILVQVSLKDLAYVHSEREFEVRSMDEYHGSYLADRDSTDGHLLVRMDAGCGVAERSFAIIRTTTGERMDLNVLFVGFDGTHPVLRVPFRPGNYEVDFTRLRESAAAAIPHDLEPSATATSRIVPCGTCAVRVDRDSNEVTLELLNLHEGGCGPGRVEMSGVGLAYCPDGQGAFQAKLQGMLDRKVGIQAKGSVLYTGIASINDIGRIHGRIEHEQTDRVHAMEMALMDGPLWSPAWVLDPDIPGGKRMVSSMVRFTLVQGAVLGK
ncbi:MAG: hypothetical protein ACO1NQ_06570 [Flavobacteriales bacterium]